LNSLVSLPLVAYNTTGGRDLLALHFFKSLSGLKSFGHPESIDLKKRRTIAEAAPYQ
jgi:hypothetical protein